MTAISGNRTSTNFSKLPLAFCNSFTLKKVAFWNRKPILQAGTTINQTIIDFYSDIAMNIPVSVRMDMTTNKMQEKLHFNIAEYRRQNSDRLNATLTLSDGEVLMKEGDELDKDCYILTGGALSIIINGVNVATISDHGMPVGEMSFLTGQPRTATAVAKGNATLLRLPKKNMNKVLRGNPTITMTILEALVSRLRDSNQQLVTLNEKLDNNNSKALKQAEKTEQSYQTVVKTLVREAGLKKGNLEILEKMLEVLEENLGNKLNSGDTASVYKMFLDFVDYYRKQAICEYVDTITLKENMPPLMQDLFN